MQFGLLEKISPLTLFKEKWHCDYQILRIYFHMVEINFELLEMKPIPAKSVFEQIDIDDRNYRFFLFDALLAKKTQGKLP